MSELWLDILGAAAAVWTPFFGYYVMKQMAKSGGWETVAHEFPAKVLPEGKRFSLTGIELNGKAVLCRVIVTERSVCIQSYVFGLDVIEIPLNALEDYPPPVFPPGIRFTIPMSPPSRIRISFNPRVGREVLRRREALAEPGTSH